MKKKLRAIIIDDERLARNDLRSMLSEYPHIEVVSEADNVRNALELIREQDPDLLFLDIQMPGETGFDLLEKIDLHTRVIFVTAFDEYALRAFEVNAVDYLLKPVNPERLKTAIERLDHVESTTFDNHHTLDYDDAMLLTINTHLKFLRLKSIVYIQSAGDYTEVVTDDNKKGLVQKSMFAWEQRLPEKFFCRIHRSTIVNIEYINKIDEWFGNSYQVTLKGIETPLTMSRRYAALLKQKKG
ncbi:MAG: DNA-binding response regulator [Ignavibacteriae bacterium]|nr:MAG: DNA-binding response regulator [Ignavibacteriota bacterium]